MQSDPKGLTKRCTPTRLNRARMLMACKSAQVSGMPAIGANRDIAAHACMHIQLTPEQCPGWLLEAAAS